MSERTEQLILMLTPEEKELIERVSREWNQTPIETIIESIHALERRSISESDDDDIDVEQNLREALRDVKAGRIIYANSLSELLASADDEDDDE